MCFSPVYARLVVCVCVSTCVQDVLATHKLSELLRWAYKPNSFYFEYQSLSGEEPSDILMFDTPEVRQEFVF